jgi:hypothetical protein
MRDQQQTATVFEWGTFGYLAKAIRAWQAS